MLKKHLQGTVVPIKVIPKSSCDEIIGWENGELKIRLSAIAEKGNANKKLLFFLAKTLKIAKSRISILRGKTSRRKQILIHEISPDHLQKLFSH